MQSDIQSGPLLLPGEASQTADGNSYEAQEAEDSLASYYPIAENIGEIAATFAALLLLFLGGFVFYELVRSYVERKR